MSARQALRSSDELSALPRGVRRALDAMRAAPGRELDLAELSEIAGTPARTLQRQFRRFLGKSPLDALRDIRFETARHELLRGSPKSKVTEIAARAGFTHFGRFSSEYRRRYGENPSRTLERQNLRPAASSGRSLLAPVDRERPAVAVVPVDAAPGESDIARGIANSIAVALARTGLPVTTDPRSARYRVLTTFRGNGEQARLTLRLIDMAGGRYVWAHHADGATADSLLFEDRVATNLAAALQGALRMSEIDRASAKPDGDLSAYDLTLRAMPYATALSPEAGARALELLDRALGVDPDNALALALAAWCHAQRVVYQFTEDPAGESERALALATRAVGLRCDATVLAILGNAFSSIHELGMADVVIRKALAIDGGSAWAWSWSGWIDVYAGRPEAAIERFALSVELAPQDPLTFNALVGLGCAHFDAGRYADTAHAMERALAEHPSAHAVFTKPLK